MTAPAPRPPGRLAAGLAWALVAGVAAWLAWVVLGRPGVYLGDLDIYRGAVLGAAQGGSLYDFVLYRPDLRPEGFGFTYPPFAALLLWPLAWLPPAPAGVLWTLAGLAAAALIGTTVGAERSGPARAALGGALATVALLVSYPAASTLVLGQVTLFVTAAALLDAVVVPRRWRGWLTGLAGAVKLVPLAFVGYYLLTRQWAAALRAGAGFVLAGLLAAVVLPGDSRAYWGVRLWTTSLVGDPAEARNRSLLGLLLRLPDAADGPALRAGWVLLVLAVTVGAALAIRRHSAAGETVRAVVVAGCLIVAAAPISWTHYLVWVPLAGWLLVTAGGPGIRGLAWRTAGLVTIVGGTLASPAMAESLPASAPAAVLQELPGLFVAAVAALGLPRYLARPEPVSS